MQQEPNSQYLATRKWYVFVDTDTFIEWDNLLELLDHLDHKDKVYLGSPVWLPGLQFAHGGTGYVLSAGAVAALNSREPSNRVSSFHSQYGLNTTALCCGDEALARVLKSRGVRLRGYWPMFNGEAPTTLAFGKDAWCEPVVSLHHLSGQSLLDLWRWIEEWKGGGSNTVSY